MANPINYIDRAKSYVIQQILKKELPIELQRKIWNAVYEAMKTFIIDGIKAPYLEELDISISQVFMFSHTQKIRALTPEETEEYKLSGQKLLILYKTINALNACKSQAHFFIPSKL